MSEVRILENKKEIASALSEFKKAIGRSCEKLGARQMIFPGGGSADDVEAFGCDTLHGRLVIGFPKEDWGSKTPILLNLNPPENKNYAPNVEVNIPFDRIRTVSGCFVYDTALGTLVLASRGLVTSYKSRISKELVHRFFKDWLFEAIDGDQTSNLISICALNSKRITEDLSTYVSEIIRLKSELKSPVDESAELLEKKSQNKAIGKWHEGKEFVGKIESKKKETKSIYTYSHGPIKNACVEFLKAKSSGRFDVLSSVYVDIALVNKDSKASAIFEVKCSNDFSREIYKAIGQLQVYALSVGAKNCRKILVTPERMPAEDFRILSDLDIEVCLFVDGKILTVNGDGGEYSL